MPRHLIRRPLGDTALVLAVIGTAVAGAAGHASAGDGLGIGASCSTTQAQCTVSAYTPGNNGGTAAPAEQGGLAGRGSGTNPSAWAGGLNCFTAPYDPTTSQLVGLPVNQPTGPGHWVIDECVNASGASVMMVNTLTWVSNGTTPRPSPLVLAARAESKLTLPSPVIEASPAVGLPQVVQLPTWVWLPRAQWTARSATAAVPGESVTATATPVFVAWSWGDGTSTICQGPGTVYTVGVSDPSAPSPTCGHTYQVTSAQAPGRQVAVSATVSWAVAWRGAGASGTFPDLTTSATVHWTVSQIQSIQINPGS